MNIRFPESMNVRTKKPTKYTVDGIKELSSEELLKQVQTWGSDLFYSWKGKTIDDMLKYEKGAFRPALYSAALSKLHYIKTMRDLGGLSEMWHYDQRTETYIRGTEDYCGEYTRQLWSEGFKAKVVKDTLYDLKHTTGLDRNEFELPPRYIPVKGEILEIAENGSISRVDNTPELYVTSRLPVDYIPELESQLWDEFLQSSYHPNDIPFLQEWTGYCLYRNIHWWKALMLVGPTRTGKGTLIDGITHLLGEANVVNIPIQDLSKSFERVRLYKKLLNAYADIASDELKKCNHLKTVISGDRTSARDLYKSSFDFNPYAKHLFSCNEIPNVYEDSAAFYGRWRVVVVNKHQYFDGDEDTITDLKERLQKPTELSGILNWALEGLTRLLDQGNFSNCPDWEETRRIWLGHSDPLSTFLESKWVKFDSEGAVLKDDFYNHFSDFCKAKGVTSYTKQRLGKEIKQRFGKNGVITKGWIGNKTAWRGVRLLDPDKT